VDTLLADIRYATRMAWKTRVVTVVAIASLAAGIGANSAVFSLVNAILLRPRAVADPDRLVELYSGDRQQPYQCCCSPASTSRACCSRAPSLDAPRSPSASR